MQNPIQPTYIDLKIAQLNNEFRAALKGVTIAAFNTIDPRHRVVVLTRGVSSLPHKDIELLVSKIAEFSDFHPDNDPYGERDFGKISTDWHEIFWKIDYYSTGGDHHSPDAGDPTVTRRVMTIMLCEEY